MHLFICHSVRFVLRENQNSLKHSVCIETTVLDNYINLKTLNTYGGRDFYLWAIEVYQKQNIVFLKCAESLT